MTTQTIADYQRADIEDALEDAEYLAEFLHDVAYTASLSDEFDMTFNTISAWRGYALCHELLMRRLRAIHNAYYDKEESEGESENE